MAPRMRAPDVHDRHRPAGTRGDAVAQDLVVDRDPFRVEVRVRRGRQDPAPRCPRAGGPDAVVREQRDLAEALGLVNDGAVVDVDEHSLEAFPEVDAVLGRIVGRRTGLDAAVGVIVDDPDRRHSPADADDSRSGNGIPGRHGRYRRADDLGDREVVRIGRSELGDAAGDLHRIPDGDRRRGVREDEDALRRVRARVRRRILDPEASTAGGAKCGHDTLHVLDGQLVERRDVTESLDLADPRADRRGRCRRALGCADLWPVEIGDVVVRVQGAAVLALERVAAVRRRNRKTRAFAALVHSAF